MPFLQGMCYGLGEGAARLILGHWFPSMAPVAGIRLEKSELLLDRIPLPVNTKHDQEDNTGNHNHSKQS